MANLLDLPNELLFNIVSYLDVPTLCLLSYTNRRLAIIVEPSMWKSNHRRALAWAAVTGSIAAMRKVIENYGASASCVIRQKVLYGLELERGGISNYDYPDRQTPLTLAAIHGHFECVEYLMNHLEHDKKGLRISLEAIQELIWRYPSIVMREGVFATLLREPRLFRSHIAKYPDSLLMAAISKGDVDLTAKILSMGGTDVNKSHGGYLPPPSLVIKPLPGHSYDFFTNQQAMLQLFLDRDDVDWQVSDTMGLTPLSHAASTGEKWIVELLIQRCNVDINARSKLGFTALTIAIREGHGDVVEFLLGQEHIDVNAKDELGRTSFIWAVTRGQSQVVRQLLQREDVDFNAECVLGKTALH